MLLHGGMTEGVITNSPTKANDLHFTAYPLRPGVAGPPPPPRISVEGEARVLPHQCFFRDNDVEVFTRSFCLWCGPDTPGGVSLRDCFGMFRNHADQPGSAR